jgi:Na+/melibiose symporter-like transporter
MGARKLIFFTLGQVGMMMLARFFFQWILDFAAAPDEGTNEALFPAATVGAVLLGFRIFDGVTDPVAGLLGDRWVRNGRPRQQLLWTAFLIPSVGLTLTFAPTHAMPELTRWMFLLAGMFIFFVGYTFYAIPYWSLVDDYAGSDPAVRTRLSNLLGAGLLIATGLGFVGSPVLVEMLGYRDAGLIFAVAAIPLMTLPYFAAPDDTEGSDHTDDTNANAETDVGPSTRPLPPSTPTGLEPLKLALTDVRFLAVIVLFGGSQMSLTIMTAAAPFIAVDLLEGSSGDVALLLGPLLATALPLMIFTPALSRRFGWRRAVVSATALLAVVYGGTGVLGGTLVVSPLVTAALLFACGGPMIAVLLGLEGEAITECARQRSPGVVSMYFGVYNFVVKALNGVAIFAAGYLAQQARGAWGVEAIRAMSAAAGAVLLLGFAAYLLAQRAIPTASSPDSASHP